MSSDIDDDKVWVFELTDNSEPGFNEMQQSVLHDNCSIPNLVVSSPWISSMQISITGGSESLYSVTIYGIDGRIVHRQVVTSSNSILWIEGSDVESLCPGVYFLGVEDVYTGSRFSTRAVKI